MKKLLLCMFLAALMVPGVATAQNAGHFDDKTLFSTRTDRLPVCGPNEALTYVVPPAPTGVPCPLPAQYPLCTNPNAQPGCTCKIDPLPPAGMPTTMVKKGFRCTLKDSLPPSGCALGEVLTSTDGDNYSCVSLVPNCAPGEFVVVSGGVFVCTGAVPNTCLPTEFLSSNGTGGFACKSIASIVTCPPGQYLTVKSGQLVCEAPY